MAGTSLISTRNIKINVLDDNDEMPLFPKSVYELTIAENSNPTTFVDRTEASDFDITPLYKKITYKLKTTNQDPEEEELFKQNKGTFTINENTGKHGQNQT